MPLPRFQKLPQSKQDEILDAASFEFASSGFDGASIASIVERAGASKSAVYYYFADKADLYQTVLLRSVQRADSAVGDFPYDALAEGDFWEVLAVHLQRVHAHFFDQPHDIALWRDAIAADESTELGRVKRDIQAVYGDRWLRVFALGQERGEIRADLPVEVALALFEAANGVIERLALQGAKAGQEFTAAHMRRHSELGMDTMRRLLAPKDKR